MSRLSNEEQRLDAEERRELAAAIESLVQQPMFRLFVRRFLLDLGGLDNNGMGPNVFSSNALTTAHEAGKFSVLQQLVAYLTQVQPDFYPNLLKENSYAAVARIARLAKFRDEPDGGE